MIVEHLDLVDFRNYRSGSFDLQTGTTVVIGDNGQGKTNFAEALAYLATLSSFRGAPGDALVRAGADTAVIRAQIRDWIRSVPTTDVSRSSRPSSRRRDVAGCSSIDSDYPVCVICWGR